MIGCAVLALSMGTGASAAISPKISAKPDIRHNVLVGFNASPLPQGGYYYAVMTLEPYRHYTAAHQPPCSVSSDMQRTDYGYPQAGKVSLSLTPARSATGHWCQGGSYEGAIYAVPQPPACEGRYPCESEPYEPPSPCWNADGHVVCGVVAPRRPWHYPEAVPRPESKGASIVGWFVVRFHSHRPPTKSTP